jgi:hypothetical protein
MLLIRQRTFQSTHSISKFARFKVGGCADAFVLGMPDAMLSPQLRVFEIDLKRSARADVHFDILKCAWTIKERCDGLDYFGFFHERFSTNYWSEVGLKCKAHTHSGATLLQNMREL